MGGLSENNVRAVNCLIEPCNVPFAHVRVESCRLEPCRAFERCFRASSCGKLPSRAFESVRHGCSLLLERIEPRGYVGLKKSINLIACV